MKTNHLVLFSILFLFAFAGVSLAETKEGTCQLKTGYVSAVSVEVGQSVKGTCKFYIDDFFGKKIINANIEVKNTAQKPMFFQYNVAFFDKDGHLIGSASQGLSGDSGLEPGKTTQTGSCLIPLPAGKHEEVASYKIAYYESETQIGK